MEENHFDIVAKATKKYIEQANIDDASNMSFVKRFAKIILEEKEVYYKYKYLEKVNFKRNDKIVTDFLNYLNPYYADYYDMRKKDNSFIFTYDNYENTGAYSAYDIITKNRIIYIPLTDTIEDSFAIVHELMHDLNLDISMLDENPTRLFYTEGLSLLGEFLLEFYLKNKHIKQFNNPNSNSLYVLKSKAIEVDFNIKLIEQHLIDGYIDVGNIIKILEDYPKNYANDLEETIYKIIYGEQLTIDDEQPYIIGGLIATYMYDRIMNNSHNILEFFELNKMLNLYNFDQVLDYLELDYNDFELTEKSYQILQDKYKTFLKSR